ncbi:hypothetical protein BD311DRAFT_747413 [Dichomitus squalens]|uniref:Uncharacterized protein n=1 Tax=Dichomitus squalens TaxID=114155 RepID=A0A4Q9N2U8_9APHY|nr:hypothetical protein BD311DRAFT_747413 [Dichomitus squalens]
MVHFPYPGSSTGQWVTFPAFVTPTKAQSFSAPTATRRGRQRLHGLLRSRGHVSATRLRLRCHHSCRNLCVPRRTFHPFDHDAAFQAVIEVPCP